MITEIGLMGGKPSTNIMDPTTPEGQIMTTTYTSIFSHPTGPKNVYWGIQIEDPLKVWALFDWDSVSDHEIFAKIHGGEAVKDLPKILTHGIFTKHITLSSSPSLSPSPALALQAPVTQFILIYFSSSISGTEKDSALVKVREELGDFAELKGRDVSVGWGTENDFPILGSEKGKEEGEGEGRKGCVLMVFIGWGTEEESKGFKGRLGVVEGIEGCIGVFEGSVRFRCLVGKEEGRK